MATNSVHMRCSDNVTLLLYGLPAVIEPLVAGVAALGSREVADASHFGARGTLVAGVVAAVIAATGVFVVRRAPGRLFRSCLATVLGFLAGLVGLEAFALVFAGGRPVVLGALLIHAMISIMMISRAVRPVMPAGAGR
ncbi:hypothetical protein [Actinoplanes sp. HUAS TT8]|uniref:hypothetical protein n=1 Tax=Actinoplanes sp. HUAS TT8 TaxID=3447453 RepID=UPI003F528AB7